MPGKKAHLKVPFKSLLTYFSSAFFLSRPGEDDILISRTACPWCVSLNENKGAGRILMSQGIIFTLSALNSPSLSPRHTDFKVNVMQPPTTELF